MLDVSPDLIVQGTPEELKNTLEGLPKTEKGAAFEKLLAELYSGNGWIVSVHGGRGDEGADILLSHPKTPSNVSLIVQAKNHGRPLTLDQTRIELIKFEQQAAERYKCQQFRLVAVNGFVDEAKKLTAFNLLLDSWNHVESLIKTYLPVNVLQPDIELFAHNRVAYEEVVRLWEETNQVAVVQATGTGKSFIIAKVMSDFQGQRKIVLAPSHYILDQQKGKAPWVNDKTHYWTYAGLARKTDEQIEGLKADLIVLDEFHRCGADIWGAGVKKLLDSHPDAKALGTSATPIRYLDESRDMAEELFDGVIAADLSLAEAIVKRILPAPTYISALYTLDEEIKELLVEVDSSNRAGEEKKKLREEVEGIAVDWEKTSGVPEILRKHLPKEMNKLIVFCKDRKHLDEMEIEVQKWFQKAGTHRWREKYRILSSDPASRKNLERFREASGRDTIHILFAVDMLNEGLHIPEVGAVILLRPTESPNVFYQQIGRCIEVGKDHSPIILDLVNNFRNVRASDYLSDLESATTEEAQIRTKLGLETHAPSVQVSELTREIEEVFDTIRERLTPWEVMYEKLVMFKGKHGHCNVPAKYPDNPSLGRWVSTQRKAWKKRQLSDDRIKRLQEIGLDRDPLESAWENMYAALVDFREKHGHCIVPRAYLDNPSLGQWVGTQRNAWKKGQLSDDRIKRLQEVGLDRDTFESAWENMYVALVDFREKYGHCIMPERYPDNPSLSSWVNTQRNAWKKGRLSDDRIKRLQEIGLDRDPFETSWEEMFTALGAFKEKHGHCNVPRAYPANPSLASWVNNQRNAWKRGRLSDARTKKLQEIGLVNDPMDSAWEEMFTALGAFKEKYGHCIVPARYPDNPSLGQWVSTQRQEWKKGQLPDDRTIRLQEVGLDRDPFESAWENMYAALVDFSEKYGHCNVPRAYPDNPSLGQWVSNQRHEWKKGQLSDDRIKRLQQIGLDRDPFETAWEEMFTTLGAFKKKHGHFNVPRAYPDNPSLGPWVKNQRREWKEGQLSADRIKRLEEIGLVIDPMDSAWEEMFTALGAFKEKHGHCNVPQRYPANPSLGTWVSTRRRAWKKGRLPAERVKRLEEIGLVRDAIETAWENMYAALVAFKKKYGHCNVPAKYLDNPSLGPWVNKQSREWKKGQLSADRIKRLEELGFTWARKQGLGSEE